MIYTYQCPECKIVYDIYQKMRDEHGYVCPRCGKKCKRMFTLAQIKKNKGFYSHTLGENVSSHRDFSNKLNACRVMNDNDKYVDADFQGKDEWVEKRELDYMEQRKEAAMQRELNEKAMG